MQALLAKGLDWPPVWTLGGLVAIWLLAVAALVLGAVGPVAFLVLGRRAIAHLHRIHTPGHFDHRCRHGFV